MIEGLKVTVVGTELQKLCLARAAHHKERVKAYAEQIDNMAKANVEGMQYTGGDPNRAMMDKKAQHEAEQDELEFIAAHLVPTEQYLLDSHALTKLGVSRGLRY